MNRQPRLKDETGNRYGALLVVCRSTNKRPSNKTLAYWECRCDCGVVKSICGSDLRSGSTVSCGCARAAGNKGAFKQTHGKTNTRAFAAWHAMRQRCFLKTCKAFPRYGGRGITVCDRWANSFEAFLEDMGEPPIGYSIERREVNGNYEPRNCEWIPRWDQAHNRENTMYVEVAGEKIRLVELADAIGIARHRLYERLARHGTIYGKAPHVRRATEAAIAKWKALAVTTLL